MADEKSNTRTSRAERFVSKPSGANFARMLGLGGLVNFASKAKKPVVKPDTETVEKIINKAVPYDPFPRATRAMQDEDAARALVSANRPVLAPQDTVGLPVPVFAPQRTSDVPVEQVARVPRGGGVQGRALGPARDESAFFDPDDPAVLAAIAQRGDSGFVSGPEGTVFMGSPIQGRGAMDVAPGGGYFAGGDDPLTAMDEGGIAYLLGNGEITDIPRDTGMPRSVRPGEPTARPQQGAQQPQGGAMGDMGADDPAILAALGGRGMERQPANSGRMGSMEGGRTQWTERDAPSTMGSLEAYEQARGRPFRDEMDIGFELREKPEPSDRISDDEYLGLLHQFRDRNERRVVQGRGAIEAVGGFTRDAREKVARGEMSQEVFDAGVASLAQAVEEDVANGIIEPYYAEEIMRQLPMRDMADPASPPSEMVALLQQEYGFSLDAAQELLEQFDAGNPAAIKEVGDLLDGIADRRSKEGIAERTAASREKVAASKGGASSGAPRGSSVPNAERGTRLRAIEIATRAAKEAEADAIASVKDSFPKTDKKGARAAIDADPRVIAARKKQAELEEELRGEMAREKLERSAGKADRKALESRLAAIEKQYGNADEIPQEIVREVQQIDEALKAGGE